MANKTLFTPDGKRHWIDSDSHFRDLIREYMGNDAADWYEDRIHGNDKANDVISKHFNGLESLVEINKALDKMTLDQWHELFWTLGEIRGWDQ